ncbi:MAG: glycosyltransferase [Ignavibacteria bacterium]|jgi:GT2 family glycosyltransferase/glycosyltransferase involved in cell wall biosynthesis/cytochrome c-type biogenesis protein CcmH/NrfG|nr:glycosyltransferase [Ignavibacteria bacterium]
MKVVHLSALDSGGAGKAAYRLHRGLLELGVDSKMLVMQKSTKDDSVTAINPRISKAFEGQWERWNSVLRPYRSRPQGLEIFTEFTSGIIWNKLKEIEEADIVNLHWAAGMFTAQTAPLFFQNKKLVWTLHDMNAFTGGCHYSASCNKYSASCGACPQLGSNDTEDMSRKNWELKNDVYRKMKITVATPSLWLSKCAKESSLFKKKDIHVIKYGIPTTIYAPLDRNKIRTALNISKSKKVILFVADSVTNERKGLKYLISALNLLEGDNITLAVLGSNNNVNLNCKHELLFLGSISDENTIASIYNLADVFVIPSTEDNLPNTVIESLSCGTPVVGFNIGGIPDMVTHKKNGYLADPGNIDDLKNGIEWILHNGDYEHIRKECRNKALREFQLRTQAENYLSLYDKILQEKSFPKIFSKNKNSTPVKKITVITPSYNQDKFLEECIDSVLTQNYPDLEYIIMDGGSTDNSVNIIKKYEKHLHYWQSKPDGGQYNALNEGFRHSSGEIMTWLNSDDKFYDEALKIVSGVFSRRTDIEWLMGRPNGFAADGSEAWISDYPPKWSRAKYLLKVYQDPYIQQEGTFWRRKLWDKAGSYISTQYRLAGDLELWTRFFRSAQLHTVDALLAGFRHHSGQKTARDILTYNRETEAILDLEYQLYERSSDKTLMPAPETIFLDESQMPSDQGQTRKVSPEFENKLKALEQAISTGDSREAKTHVLKLLANKSDKGRVIDLLGGDDGINKRYPLTFELLYCAFFSGRTNEAEKLNSSIQSSWINSCNQDGHDKQNFKTNRFTVTAIVSVYNSEKFIKGCLDDLIGQTLYKKEQLEIVLVNTGSEENEDEIIRRYCEKYANIEYIKINTRETIYQAWNRGIKAGKGKYITNANTDDRHRSDALEVMAAALDENPSAALVYGDIFVTNFGNQTFENFINCGYQIRPDYKKEIMLTGCHMGPQPMWRKSLHWKLGFFNEELKSAGDYEFWCRIAAKHEMFHIRDFLGLYLENSSGVVNANINQSVMESDAVKHFYAAHLPFVKENYAYNYQFIFDSKNPGFVNICMITFNRLEYTKQSIKSIVQYTSFPHVLTVVDNGSTDGTREYLKELKRRGIIKNLILLDSNIGVAKASNLAWLKEPEAEYYLKLDNDIVIQKPNWLREMINAVQKIPTAGAVAYNFEPVSYPIQKINGVDVRPKTGGILGGACILLPKRTNKLLGYWCEDYGLYGEEDADYGFRINVSNLQNIYMLDENIGFHLPSGKAAVIDQETLKAIDEKETIEHREYRKWKDEQRIGNVKGGKLPFNLQKYLNGQKSLYVKPEIALSFSDKAVKDKAPGKLPESTGIKVSVIVPVYNRVELTQKCLESVYRNTGAQENYELIIVDNASIDGTQTLLKEYQGNKSNFSVLRSERNLGFSRANNLAARTARGSYLLFLNNDTEVRKGWMEMLVKILDKDAKAAAAGSKLLFPDGTIQHAGIGIFDHRKMKDPLLAQHLYLHQPADCSEAEVMTKYQSLTAACLLVRRSAFEEVGGFDEGYWNGYEDVDLCFKLRQRGYSLVYQPESVVIHYESQSGAERFSKVSENIQRLHRKWLGKVKPDFITENDGRTFTTDANIIKEYLLPGEDLYKVSSSQKKKSETFVSIVVLTFNGLKFNKECINSILKHTKLKYEIIIVDNASTDGTVTYLKNLQKKYARIKVILNDSNYGFPKAINQALKAASGNYLVIANNDIVVTEGWLQRMLEVAESDAKTGIVGPISNLVSGIQMDENAKYKTIPEMHKYAKMIKRQNSGKTLEYLRVSFLCTLIKKEVIDLIGGLDERFSPGNFEDDDFCLRSHIAGYKTVIAEDVFVHHYGSKSFRADGYEKYAKLIRLNEKKFLEKWGVNIDEIWLEKKQVKERSISFPIHQDEFIQSYLRALVHFVDNEYDLAEQVLKQSIDIYESEGRSDMDDKYGNVLNLYGNLYLKKNDLKNAINYFERELRSNPGSVPAYLGLGEAFFVSERYQESKHVFQMALMKEPKDSCGIAGLAKTNSKLGLSKDHNSLASEPYSVNSIKNPDSNGRISESNYTGSSMNELLNRAEELIGQNNPGEAVELLSEIINKNPANTDALNDLAVISIMTGDLESAVDFLEKVVRIDPGNEVALGNMNYLSELLEEKSSQPSEIEHPDSSLKESKEESKRQGIGSEYKTDKRQYGRLVEKAETFIESGELSLARKVLETVLLLESENIDALNDLSVVEIMEKNYPAAAEILERVIKKDPSNEVAAENILILQRELDKL